MKGTSMNRDRYAPRRIAPPPRHDAFRVARTLGWAVLTLLALAAVALSQQLIPGTGYFGADGAVTKTARIGADGTVTCGSGRLNTACPFTAAGLPADMECRYGPWWSCGAQGDHSNKFSDWLKEGCLSREGQWAPAHVLASYDCNPTKLEVTDAYYTQDVARVRPRMEPPPQPSPTPRPSPTPPVVEPTPPPPVVEPTPSPATCPAGTACRPEPAECATCPPVLPACPPLSAPAESWLQNAADSTVNHKLVRTAGARRVIAELARRRGCVQP